LFLAEAKFYGVTGKKANDKILRNFKIYRKINKSLNIFESTKK